ncbi:hypothetical protein KUM39_22355 [Streptomyces sp. J2-1]|uniref:hypothetical protein n=1 Tax=Streptomyces corallincola TaxID=2851888 RepID=UPI001C38FAB4|nr:hypothetical protein [Streptomyces corallincola]MBV2357082.1 hypothetical protein [Streptomyces corallincola]
MSGLINYVSFGILWLGLLVKAPDLIRNRRDPFLLSITGVLASASLCFLFGAPPTVGFINRVSGVPNLAAPLTYGAITACGAAHLVLIVCWRGGPGMVRSALRWVLGYTAVLVGIAVTFALGETPVERRTDFDTYYATTPFVAEMIVLYLLAHLTAVSLSAFRSLGWARHVHGPLRAGLLTMGTGTVVTAGYSSAKTVAVVAGWSGRDWSFLGTDLAPACAGLGAALTVTGIMIPLAWHHLATHVRTWREYVRLRPLERALEDLLDREYLRVPRPSWPSAHGWLTWRQNSVYNGLSYLDRQLDQGLYRRVYADRLAATGDPDRAEAAAWASAVVAATRSARVRDQHHAPDPAEAAAPARPGLPALLRIADELSAVRGSGSGAPVPQGVPAR